MKPSCISSLRSHLRSTLHGGLTAFCFALGFVGACGRSGPSAPTPPSPPPSSTPAFALRVEQGSASRTSSLSELPSVAYSWCGEIKNVGTQSAIWKAEMSVYGSDGTQYITEPRAGQTPERTGPGEARLGCGMTSVRDYDSTHLQAIKYRIRVSYTLEGDGSKGEVEGESSIRPFDPDIRAIVISEFRPRGPNGDQDQFLELRNVSSSPVSIRGWYIQPSSRSFEVEVGTVSYINEGTINPGCYYLLTATTPPFSSTYGTYSGSVRGDGVLRPVLHDAGGFAIRTPTGQVVDQVGLGDDTVFKEGTPLAPFGGENSDRSYTRVGPDTGDNAADFRMIRPSTPRNSQTCQ